MKYSFQKSGNVSIEYALKNYRKVTFPDIFKRNAVKALNGPLLAVSSMYGDELVGLALVEVNRINHPAEVVSLVVKKEHRGRGIGTRMLDVIESVVKNTQHKIITINFQSNWGSYDVIKHILTKRKWDKPEKVYLICHASRSTFEDLYTKYDHLDLPKEYTIFHWGDLSLREKQEILNDREQNSWFPLEFSPFINEDKVEYMNSLGLRYNNNVVGWNLAYRFNQDTIEYNNLYVHPEHRLANVTPVLIRDSLKIQYHSKIENGTWIVNYKNRPMIHITNSFRGRITQHIISYVTKKTIL